MVIPIFVNGAVTGVKIYLNGTSAWILHRRVFLLWAVRARLQSWLQLSCLINMLNLDISIYHRSTHLNWIFILTRVLSSPFLAQIFCWLLPFAAASFPEIHWLFVHETASFCSQLFHYSNWWRPFWKAWRGAGQYWFSSKILLLKLF